MSIYYEDTIAAISTATGAAGIGIVRISGKNSIEIINKIFTPKNTDIPDNKDRKLVYGHIINPSNNLVVDEVLVCKMYSPNTYTKEDVVEINCHGGIVSVRVILNLLMDNGARLADPGEFTKRAFLNGRIDLTQAEAIIDIINSKTQQSLELSMKQLSGSISSKISNIRNVIMEMLAHIEASIDYPEYDIEEVSYNDILKKCNEVKDMLDTLIYDGENGKIIREGLSTAIIGRPNVGKSSLLNALLGENRAIVTEIPGTTRDTIEDYINIDGVALKIIDTAGIRDTDNTIEKIGIDRSKELINNSDLILLIIDITKPMDSEDEELIKLVQNKKSILIFNKVDKSSNVDFDTIKKYNIPIVQISATEEIGLKELKSKITDIIFSEGFEKESFDFISNIRHINLLKSARDSVVNGISTITQDIPIEIVSVDLKDAWIILGEITGETVHEDLIDKIFSNFCIGK